MSQQYCMGLEGYQEENPSAGKYAAYCYLIGRDILRFIDASMTFNLQAH